MRLPISAEKLDPTLRQPTEELTFFPTHPPAPLGFWAGNNSLASSLPRQNPFLMTGLGFVAPQGVVLHLSVCSVYGRTKLHWG